MSKNQPKLPPLPGGEERREQARAARHAAVERQQEEARRRDRRRRLQRQLGLPALAVVLVVGTTLLVLALRGEPVDPVAINDRPTPFDATGAISFGATDPQVVVEVVEDFQCPVCRQFEQSTQDQLATYRADPRIQVRYRPIAFLDRASTARYSSRAANAAACVAEEGPEEWLAFHGVLFANQPAEGTAGLTDDELLDLAEEAGVERDRVEDCITDELYGDWVSATTAATFAGGDVTGTPTVFVDGTRLSGFDAASIKAAVDEALS